MTIAESILPEFDVEMGITRRALERVPNDNLDWSAHEKSHTFRWVAAHLAEIPGWVEAAVKQDSWDINPVGAEPYKTPEIATVREALELFDANVALGRTLIAETSDSVFQQPWSLIKAGETLFTIPKIGVVRSWVLNHMIHHRGILCVYLRLNDIPVPSIYGPSGDE